MAIQRLHLATLDLDQIITLLNSYIVIKCHGIDITNINEHIFFLTKSCQEICTISWNDDDYLTFNLYLKAGIEAEVAVLLKVEYNRALKCMLKDRVHDILKEGYSKACKNLAPGPSSQSMS